MTEKIKRIGLIIGLLSTIISFLFFGRQQGMYQMLLLSGLVVSLIFYLTILFGKETTKSRIVWTLVVILAWVLQWLTQPLLIKSSYLIYLNNNYKELAEVNNILKDKFGNIYITNSKTTNNHLLTQTEKDIIVKSRKALKVYMISKTDNGIYYGLWGFLDVRIGLTYWTKTEKPSQDMKQLKDKWYY